MRSTLSIILLIFVAAGGALSQGSSKPDTGASKVVELTIEFVDDSRLCSESTIEVAIKLVNRSKERLVIDRNMMWYMLSYSYLRVSAEGATSSHRTAIGEVGPDYKPDFVSLDSNEGLNGKKMVPIAGEFFKNPGVYSVRVTYAQFGRHNFMNTDVWRGRSQSNIGRFSIRECESTKD